MTTRRGGRSQGRIVLAVCLGLDALILWLAFGPYGAGFDRRVYAKTVDQALADFERSLPSRRLRVSGVLVSGSAAPPAHCEMRLRLRPAQGPAEPELSVRYRGCGLPDTFCDLPGYELHVHVTGRFADEAGAPLFEATSLTTSCPGKYSVDRSVCETAPEAARRRCPMCL